MSLATRVFVARAQRVRRRAARQRRRQLERELAGYCTAAQQLDFEATLERYPDGVTYELRGILAQQQAQRDLHRRVPAHLAGRPR